MPIIGVSFAQSPEHANLHEDLATQEMSGCGDSIWSDKWNMPPGLWERYKTHLRANHPEFEKWRRRSGLAYLVALVPFFSFALAAAVQSSATVASLLAILMFPSTLFVIAVVWMHHRMMKYHFHRSWVLGHGLPKNAGPEALS